MVANATSISEHAIVRTISWESSVRLNALWTVRMEGNALLRGWALTLPNKRVNVAFSMKEISAKRSASVNSIVKMEEAACFQRIIMNPLRTSIVSARRNGWEKSVPSLVRVKMEAPAAGFGIENLTRRRRTPKPMDTIATALLGMLAATVSLKPSTESALWSVTVVDTALKETYGLLMTIVESTFSFAPVKKDSAEITAKSRRTVALWSVTVVDTALQEKYGLMTIVESTKSFSFAPVKKDTAEITANSTRTVATSLVRMVVSVLVMKLAYRVDTIECWRTGMVVITIAAAKKDSLVIFVNERNVGRGSVRMAPRVFSCHLVEVTMYVTAPLVSLMIFMLLDVIANPLHTISAMDLYKFWTVYPNHFWN
jgi:flagellar motor switch/type III secretory pathway protein FliN